MKCPFELPTKKEVTHVTEAGVKYKIVAGKHTIAAFLSKDEADYILQAINSHWNLVEYREYVHARIEDGKPIMRYSKWLDTVEELERALEEAESH